MTGSSRRRCLRGGRRSRARRGRSSSGCGSLATLLGCWRSSTGCTPVSRPSRARTSTAASCATRTPWSAGRAWPCTAWCRRCSSWTWSPPARSPTTGRAGTSRRPGSAAASWSSCWRPRGSWARRASCAALPSSRPTGRSRRRCSCSCASLAARPAGRRPCTRSTASRARRRRWSSSAPCALRRCRAAAAASVSWPMSDG
mmetsp:Transcript_29943/g.80089  ORF Transcript_29943/g.80089 Transcript_29943/m.80089 type:complete len:200 (-) Transcript_29943:159-758(-)